MPTAARVPATTAMLGQRTARQRHGGDESAEQKRESSDRSGIFHNVTARDMDLNLL
jgi:hypothetical protein